MKNALVGACPTDVIANIYEIWNPSGTFTNQENGATGYYSSKPIIRVENVSMRKRDDTSGYARPMMFVL